MPTNSRPRVIVLGGGGHAKVVIDVLRMQDRYEIAGVLDSDPSRWGSVVGGVRVLGGDQLISSLPEVTHFVVGLGSIGNADRRIQVFDAAVAQGLRPAVAVHPRAVVADSALLGDGTVVMAGAVVNPSTRIGLNAIVNTGAIVDHDCVLDDHVHVATGARLSGAVCVGRGAHVGAGATVRQGITIGAGAIVGAGAVVVRDVAPRATVAGVPARLMSSPGREVTDGH